MPKHEHSAVKPVQPLSESGPDERRSRRWKFVIGLAVVAAGVASARHFGVLDFLNLDNIDRLDGWFDGLGWWAPLVFVFLWIASAVFFLPGLILTIAGGLIFGAVWGTVWTTVGANLGAIAAFLIGRYLARGTIENMMERHGGLKRIDDGVRRQGWRMLVITRLVPVFPFNLQNYAYGLTDIPLKTYALVTLPCMLPATIAFNFAAGSVRTGDLGRTLWYLGVAAVFFVLLSLIPKWVGKKASSAAPDDDSSQ
jgi:uncharacterized membrane protein YdjX (TVP38/TMEM64 family)